MMQIRSLSYFGNTADQLAPIWITKPILFDFEFVCRYMIAWKCLQLTFRNYFWTWYICFQAPNHLAFHKIYCNWTIIESHYSIHFPLKVYKLIQVWLWFIWFSFIIYFCTSALSLRCIYFMSSINLKVK